jgi:hypothetical protein
MSEELLEKGLKFSTKYLSKWGSKVPLPFYFYLAERWATGYYKKFVKGKSTKVVG